jgi:peptidoglycan hydrolase-like protein with peptidoglycan-binding domain/LysM repeat protein
MVKPVSPSSQPSQGPGQSEQPPSTTVRQGESFDQVAQRNQVSPEQLRRANPNVDPGRVQAGQELNLPPAGQAAAQPPSGAAPTGQTAAADPAARTSMLAEQSLAGQARAAHLTSQLDLASAPPGTTTPTSTPTAGGPPPGGAAPGGTPAPAGGTPPAGTGPAAYSRTLSHGDTGSDVEQLQGELNQWRASQGQTEVPVNGRYGGTTRAAVHDFQQATGLEHDGVAGSRTTDRLALENDPSFRSLRPETQRQVRDQMTQHSGQPGDPDDPASRTNLRQLATDPNFAHLSPEGQDQALQRFAQHPADAAQTQEIRNEVRDRANLENNANFRHLNDATRQQVLNQMGRPGTTQAERTNLTNLATDPNFSQLPRAQQDQTLQALSRNPGSAEYTQQLRNLTGSENFRHMDNNLRSRMIQMSATHANNPAYTRSLDRLVRHDQFGRMGTENQRMTLNVFENTTPAGRTALMGTLNRTINGQPALLSRGEGSTGTLLSQMNRLSTTNLDARLQDNAGQPINRSRVTEQLLQEVADPSGNINQGNRGTCTVTSMSRDLAARNPAEYARIVTDLSTTGTSRLANGDNISVPPDAWRPDNGSRSHGERLIQSSLMQYATPGTAYRNSAGPGADGINGTPDDGLDQHAGRNQAAGLVPSEEQRVLNGLYGRNYDIYTGSANFRDDRVDRMQRVREELAAGRGPVHVDLGWGPGGHAVEVTGVTPDGRVMIRNPWGRDVGPDFVPGSNPPQRTVNGTAGNNTNAGPLRRTEDQAHGMESMSVDDFQNACRQVYVPAD